MKQFVPIGFSDSTKDTNPISSTVFCDPKLTLVLIFAELVFCFVALLFLECHNEIFIHFVVSEPKHLAGVVERMIGAATILSHIALLSEAD